MYQAAYVVEETKSHVKQGKDQGLGPAAGEVAEEGEKVDLSRTRGEIHPRGFFFPYLFPLGCTSKLLLGKRDR